MVRRRGIWSFIGGLLLVVGLVPASVQAHPHGLDFDIPPLEAPRWPEETPVPEESPPPPVRRPVQPKAEVVGAAADFDLVPPGKAVESLPIYRRAWDPITLGTQLGLELTGAGLAILAGYLVGTVYNAITWDGWTGAILGSFTGAISLAIVHPLAVYAGGRLSAGRGTFAGVLLGYLLGVGAAIGLGAAALSVWDPGGQAFLAILSALSFFAGPILGYHISHRVLHPREKPPRRPAYDRTRSLQSLREQQAPRQPTRRPPTTQLFRTHF